MAEGFGAFGKIPALGDFFRLNVSADFMQSWDTWLQEGMVFAKSTLGDAWVEAYLSAPIWRFTLSAGIAGARPISGIVMASLDRVGRQYPLTLVTTHSPGDVALTHFANRTVFEAMEDLALAALDDNFTKDQLQEGLEGLVWITPEQGLFRGKAYVGATPPAQILAAQALGSHMAGQAIWSATMEGDHRLMVTQTLPQGAELLSLFDLTAPLWQSSFGQMAGH